MTYVAFRSKISGQKAIETVSQMVEEITCSHKRIVAILEGYPDALESWLVFERGYM